MPQIRRVPIALRCPVAPLEPERRPPSVTSLASPRLVRSQDGDTPPPDFIAILAHEWRQPLGTLSAAIEVIRATDDAALRALALVQIERQVAQMNRAVEDVLDATRWARGKMTLRARNIDLRSVIADVAMDLAPAVAARSQTLTVATGACPLWANIDPQRIYQMLANLLTNAVKYTPPTGRIALSAMQTPKAIILRIADTGRGIPTAALSRIFELYSQVRPTNATGVGVGLSVAREIARLHSGHIEAHSAGAGKGSLFVVTLPRARRP